MQMSGAVRERHRRNETRVQVLDLYISSRSDTSFSSQARLSELVVAG